jgi:hypothetical protein
LFNKEILERLFIETDKNLKKEETLVLIGGTALVIKYLSPRATDLPGLTRSRIYDKIWAMKGPDHAKKEMHPRGNHPALAYG